MKRSGKSPIRVASSPIEGKGVFTTEPVQRDDTVLILDTSRVVDEEHPLRPEEDEQEDHLAYLAGGKVVLLPEPERHLNHSCDPNAHLHTVDDEVRVVARRSIQAGAEVTIDYLINTHGGSSWRCRCGADRCRGQLETSFFELPIRIQREYLPLLESWFIEEHREEIERLKERLGDRERRWTGRHPLSDWRETPLPESERRQELPLKKPTPEAYVRRVVGLLGDRDPVTVLRESVPWIRSAVDGLSRDVLREPEAPGKWSLVEVAQHLADTELIYRYRMRLIVAQPGSDLPAYDQDRWVENLNYHDVSMSDSLGELSTLRRANLHWLPSLTDEDLERTGIHDRRGPESVRRIVQLLAGHDLVHRHQIERIKAAVA